MGMSWKGDEEKGGARGQGGEGTREGQRGKGEGRQRGEGGGGQRGEGGGGQREEGGEGMRV